jgi:hypothetical protein
LRRISGLGVKLGARTFIVRDVALDEMARAEEPIPWVPQEERTKNPPQGEVQPLPHDGADSVERFAEKNAISRAQAFVEIASGRLIARKVGSRTIITQEDAAKWRKSLPKAAARKSNGRQGRSNPLPALMQPVPWTPTHHRGRPKKPKQSTAGAPPAHNDITK